MKLLRIFALLLLTVFIVGFFVLPTDVNIEKSIVIDTPHNPVYSTVTDLRSWDLWSPWHRLDSNIVSEYSDVTNRVGASWKFYSPDEKFSPGKIVMANIEDEKVITFDHYMNQVGEEKAFSTYMTLEDMGNQVKVTWSMKEELPSWNLFIRLLHPKMIGEKLEEFFNYGLSDLKIALEESYGDGIQSVDMNTFVVEEIDVPEKYYISILDSVDYNSSAFYRELGEDFKYLIEYTMKREIPVDTRSFPAFIITKNIDEENNKYVYEVGMYVENLNYRKSDDVRYGSFPAGKYVMTRIVSNFDLHKENLEKFEAFCQLNEIETEGELIENYLMDFFAMSMEPMMRTSQDIQYFRLLKK